MRKIFIYLYCIMFIHVMPEVVLANQDDLSREVHELKALIMEMKDSYEAKINEMQAKVAMLCEQKSIEEEDVELKKELELLFNDTDEQAVSAPGIQTAPGGFTGGQMFENLMMNVSVIGDSVANVTWSEKSIEEGRGDGTFAENEFADRISLRETEIGLQGVLDPYARADFYLTSEDGGSISIEEGFVTWLYLPFGLQAKAGIFRTSFGRMNKAHRPEISQIDYPSPIKNLLGAEGQKEPGISTSGMIPNPWDIYSEFTAEVLTPSSDRDGVEGVSGRDQIYLAHLKNFFAITDNSTIELGFSFQTRDISDNDEDTVTKRNFRHTMEGIDLTYIWRPAGRRLYKSFTWQTEAFASQREVGSFDENGITEDIKDINSLGFYTFGEYQLTRRLFAGVRFDYSQFLTNDKDSEWAITPYMTFWQSEFTRLRLEYSHKERNSVTTPVEEGDNSLTLQATFSLGSHRPHPF